MRFEHKTVLVTGGGRGIGRAIAIGFAREGASVALNAAHLSSAEEAAEIARGFGGNVMAIEADVADENEVNTMVDRVVAEFGSLDILVNNAGVSQPLVPLIEQEAADFDRTIAINLRGTYLCCKAAAKGMVERGSGNIVNIASITAHTGPPMRTAYASSKAAVVNLTMALAVELGKHNINVNSISPGYVVTDLVKNFINQGKINEEAILRRTPLGRMSTTEDIAKAALFLASADAGNITGADLLVDAGWTANGYYM
ncbi:glucose 1-dehydrogenase [Candidatus Bipolaricaulota bacterium]|nr:glucose 1-dehydrogenase [Candidatus Bipolaricaulota bacterium]